MLVSEMIETIISFVIGMFGTYTVLDLINRRNNTAAIAKQNDAYVKQARRNHNIKTLNLCIL